MLEILFWILIITIFTVFGSWYSRKYKRPDALIGLYVAFVLISNIIAFKIVEFNLGFYTFYATAATLVFAVTFLMTDIVNERFGRVETQKMILIAFISQIATACFIWIALSLKPAPFFTANESFTAVLGFAPRVMIAGWIAFIISENLDAYIFSWFKTLTKGKHLWLRNSLSSIPAMLIDSIIFVTIAFYGLQDLLPLILGVTVIKWIVGIIDIPFMYLNRYVLYKK
ncbi:MAG: queuosine precursor transporter [Candidatus Pacearchaeota archaeon]|jgi:hypothetical protein